MTELKIVRFAEMISDFIKMNGNEEWKEKYPHHAARLQEIKERNDRDGEDGYFDIRDFVCFCLNTKDITKPVTWATD